MPEPPRKSEANPTPGGDECRTCGKPVRDNAPTYPFCCERCRKIDLGRWFDESYIISRPLDQSDLDEE